MDMDDRTLTGAVRTSIRFRPMTEQTPTLPPPSTRQTAWARARNIAGALSLTRIQSIVATLAGITSLVGAVYSVRAIRRAWTNGGTRRDRARRGLAARHHRRDSRSAHD